MLKWSVNRKMEFTRLNTSTKSDSADGGWHMVIAPRSAEKSSDQQGQLDGEFCRSLPRAHFLRPGCFRAAAERGAFSPDSHDLCFKGEWLQDQCSWDSKGSASVARSCGPHPLAQPGFYSPKIPRSRHCEPTTEFSMTKNTKEYCAHTLPLPHTKLAVLKQSALSCRPQGIKTSLVEKPRLMRAAISPTLPNSTPIDPIQQQTYDQELQHVKDQDIQTQCFSSLHQCSVNLTRTEISKKQERLWNHCDQAQSTKKQSFFSVKKWAQDPHVFNNSFTLPQSPSSPDDLNLRRDSKLTGYRKLSVFNGTCYTPQDGSNCASSSQSHGRSTENNSKQKNRQDSSEVGNYSISNSNKRQVDTKSKNVFGQPCVIATLRSGCSPQPVRKTTIVEDLKKLILLDEVTDSTTQTSRSAIECPQGSSSPTPLMFSSPVLARHPVPRPNHLALQSDPTALRRELSDTLGWDQDARFDQKPLNLTNIACKLDWNSLVNAAEAYETQELANLLTGESRDMQSGPGPEPHGPHLPHALSEIPDDNVFIDSPDQLSHLEAMLMRLSTDLLKEKKDKVALLAEVLKLRMSNQHLKEESLSANEQLQKIRQMFGISPESVE
ncbi:uncharacterized protein LOC108278520 isoform X1 [Ictalurus punctatus]|uniref:Uncharacterized protein LOC108278520 isoform X1 n=1 Tax=Ictalurus punctatus TaxID=7998 RepID=A0A979FC85_ICTPU|nr:uncharacterized protein LOC108278520 isoform X1 [Ictalurus punctatus]XP_047017783.1 uncharacterized protein LOC108278520 isoform X1 [Ictalurus punctatus]